MAGNDDAKKLILARRARFLAAALATVATATTASVAGGGCGGDTEPTTSDGGTGTADGAEPQPCLAPLPPDASGDTGVPQPCLSIAPDAGKDAEPQPCLQPPIDGG